MRRRHPALPRLWLMTDERMGDDLLPAIRRLPKGKAGVVLRNYSLAMSDRRAMFEAARKIARRNRLVLLLGGPERLARRWRADGWHGPGRRRNRSLIHGMAVHDPAELGVAIRAEADLIFLSPVFVTRSHPGARALGRIRFGMLARSARMPVIALGGMTSSKWRSLKRRGAYGYAAIDDWLK